MDPFLSEKEKYDKLWATVPEYREVSPADFLTPLFLDYFGKEIKKGDGVIDFGCGSGRSSYHLLKAGLAPHLIDFSDQCLDPYIYLLTLGENPSVKFSKTSIYSLRNEIKAKEWIICFDVLEHIPEKMIKKSLKGIAERMIKGGVIGIALIEDSLGETIGETLHLCVKPANWWTKELSVFFQITQTILVENKYALFMLIPTDS
jgi:2-polyprenyl-3-methyl-5-hydroxy-6-metoxy-1,4-benzoquinol methylase